MEYHWKGFWSLVGHLRLYIIFIGFYCDILIFYSSFEKLMGCQESWLARLNIDNFAFGWNKIRPTTMH
jgi:hypothetical protein